MSKKDLLNALVLFDGADVSTEDDTHQKGIALKSVTVPGAWSFVASQMVQGHS